MGVKSMGGKVVERHVAPRVPHLAPELTTTFVREALERAINGVKPLSPAAAGAEKHLAERKGNVDAAVRDVIDVHVRYAGAQGLLTGIGGPLVATVAIPANIAGLALIQARMVAGIAHLRGYDLDDPRVRNAILACMLGREQVDDLIKERKLPAPPMAIATAPVHDPHLDVVLSAEVASELITRVAGKRLAIAIARKVPVVGGAFGMTVDGFATWRVGAYAARDLRPRARR